MAKTEIITRTYENHSISYNADGWFNATEAAKKFGKEPYEWMRLTSTENYMDALGKALGFEPGKSRNKLIKASKVRGDAGTWLHPKMAVAFARWLDVDFAVWCDMQIDSILRGTDDKKKARHISAVSYSAMSTMLHDVRLIGNKDTQSHHYSNEAKLVNWALCGEFKSLDREVMSFKELDLIAFLEIKNMILIGRGLTYDQRKPIIKQYAMDWRMEHTPLIG